MNEVRYHCELVNQGNENSQYLQGGGFLGRTYAGPPNETGGGPISVGHRFVQNNRSARAPIRYLLDQSLSGAAAEL